MNCTMSCRQLSLRLMVCESGEACQVHIHKYMTGFSKTWHVSHFAIEIELVTHVYNHYLLKGSSSKFGSNQLLSLGDSNRNALLLPGAHEPQQGGIGVSNLYGSSDPVGLALLCHHKFEAFSPLFPKLSYIESRRNVELL